MEDLNLIVYLVMCHLLEAIAKVFLSSASVEYKALHHAIYRIDLAEDLNERARIRFNETNGVVL